MVKDQLFAPPPLFKLIHEESLTPLQEMYQVFNMGHRLEVYLPAAHAQSVIDLASKFKIDAQVIGRVEAAERSSVVLHTTAGAFEYFE